MARVIARASVDVARPVEQVFAAVADFQPDMTKGLSTLKATLEASSLWLSPSRGRRPAGGRRTRGLRLRQVRKSRR